MNKSLKYIKLLIRLHKYLKIISEYIFGMEGDQNQGQSKPEEGSNPPLQLKNPSKQQLLSIVNTFFHQLSEEKKQNKRIWHIYKKAYYHFLDQMISKEQRKFYNCELKNFIELLSNQLPNSLQKTFNQVSTLTRLYQSRDIGGVVLKDLYSNQFLMVQGVHNYIGFAKGKLQQGQSYRQAAIRQAEQQIQIQNCNLVVTKPYIFFHVQAGNERVKAYSSDKQFETQEFNQLDKMSPEQQKRITRGKDCLFFYAEVDKQKILFERQGKKPIDQVKGIHWVDLTQGIQAVQKKTGKIVTRISKSVINDIFDQSPDFRYLRYHGKFPSLTTPADIRRPIVNGKQTMEFSQINYDKEQQRLIQFIQSAIDSSGRTIKLRPALAIFQCSALGSNDIVIPKIASLLNTNRRFSKSKLFYCSRSKERKSAITMLASRLGLKSQFIFKEWIDKESKFSFDKDSKYLAEKIYIKNDSSLIICQPYSLAELINRNRMFYIDEKDCDFDWKNCILYFDVSDKMFNSDYRKVFQIFSSFPPKIVVTQFNFALSNQTVKNMVSLFKTVYPNLKNEDCINIKSNSNQTERKSERQIEFGMDFQNNFQSLTKHFEFFPFMYLKGSKSQVGCPRNILDQCIYVAEQSQFQARVVQSITLLFYGIYQGKKCILTPNSEQSYVYMSSFLTSYDLPRKFNTHYNVQTVDKQEFHRDQVSFINRIIKSVVGRLICFSTSQRILNIPKYENKIKSYISLLDFYQKSSKTLFIPVEVSQEDFSIFQLGFQITEIKLYFLSISKLVATESMKEYQGLLKAVKGILQGNIEKYFSLVKITQNNQVKMVKNQQYANLVRKKYVEKPNSEKPLYKQKTQQKVQAILDVNQLNLVSELKQTQKRENDVQ